MRLGLLLGGAVLLFGCSSAAAPATVSDSVDQETWSSYRTSNSEYLVLVVDDEPSAYADSLRAGVLESVRARARYVATTDLARDEWRPVRWQVIVVRPSGAHAIVTSAVDARLAWVEENASVEGANRVVEGVRAALAETNPDPSQTYRPIEALQEAMALLAQSRSPRTDDERAFADAIAAHPGEVSTLLASSRDDDTPDAEVARPGGQVVRGGLAVAYPPTIVAPQGTRLAAWARSGEVWVNVWPSAPPWGLDQLGVYRGWGFCDVGRKGSCEATARTSDLSPCAADRNWLDPRDRDGVRRPRLERSEIDGRMTRVCEVAPFTGEMLARCQDGRACEGSGWCLSARPSGCPTPNFRFVGGAVSARSVTYGFTCDLSSP